jgi:hypothetical protein
MTNEEAVLSITSANPALCFLAVWLPGSQNSKSAANLGRPVLNIDLRKSGAGMTPATIEARRRAIRADHKETGGNRIKIRS